ncbi:GntR family transcriptional regulator [Paralcaligenes ginsengisoli]
MKPSWQFIGSIADVIVHCPFQLFYLRIMTSHSASSSLPHERVQPQSLVDQIASRLANDIVTGVYSPGERLKEQEIALRFGTSRAPLREAFRVLEREGLIEIFPWRGVCVIRHSLEEIRELFEIRADLLAICVQRITEDGSPEKIAAVSEEIGKLIELTEAGRDERAYKQQTATISTLTSSLAGNRYLHAMVTDFRQKLLWYYCFLGQSTVERRRESNRLWQAMLEAMQRGDAWAAAKAARQVTLSTAQFALQIAEAAEKLKET